jgi:hypothetical protein
MGASFLKGSVTRRLPFGVIRVLRRRIGFTDTPAPQSLGG